jgi:uncharacterized membrane protein
MRLSGWVQTEPEFRWRGGDVTRIEAFSDAVFAFSVTLLVVSLEVPRSFDELVAAMRGFPAFGICFAILISFWHNHVRYFRRYALQSAYVTVLNSILLFCLLFYIYPLKFVFSGLLGGQGTFEGSAAVTAAQVRVLFGIYGAGYTAICSVFVLLYLHAWKGRTAMLLDAPECRITRQSIIDHVILALVGIGSIALALLLPANLVGLAGYFYFVIPLYFWISRTIRGRQSRQSHEPHTPAMN